MGQKAGSSDCVVVQHGGLAQLSKCSGFHGLESHHSVAHGTLQLGRKWAVEARMQSRGLEAGPVCIAPVHTWLGQAAAAAAAAEGQAELLVPVH